MSFRYTGKRLWTIAPLVGEDARGDAGDVGLECEHHQVAEQADVLAVVLRDALRLRHVGPRRLGELGGTLDALLDVADRREILVEALVIAAGEMPVEAARFFADEVEHAAAIALAAGAVGCGAAAEQA